MEEILRRWLDEYYPSPDIYVKFAMCSCEIDYAKFVMDMIDAHDPNPSECLSIFQKDPLSSEICRVTGNSNYKKKAFKEALFLYNRSILHATENSIEYALSLGNRAACLLAMGHPEEARVDVKLALKYTGIDPAYKEKLQNRLRLCDKAMEKKVVSSSVQEPKLPSKNDYLTSASNKVSISTRKDLGRLLIATKDIAAGEVLMVENPYASVLVPDCRYSYCWNCFKFSYCLLPCRGCSHAMFCDKNCVKAAKKYHAFECIILDQLLDSFQLSKLDLLALRVLLVASEFGMNIRGLKIKVDSINNELEEAKTYNSDDFCRIYDLVGNSEKRSERDLFLRTFTAGCIVSSLNKYTNFFMAASDLQTFATSFLLHFMLNLPCNAHEVTEVRDGDVVEVGAAAYATFSLLNHSCDPNVVRHSCAKRVVLRAIKSIKAGEELVDNYGYHYAVHDIKKRQTGLQQYYFTCQCEPCLKNWPLYPSLPSEEPTFKSSNSAVRTAFSKLSSDFEETLEKVMTGEVAVENMEFLCNYIDFLDEHIEKPWQEYNKCQEAFKFGLKFLPDFCRKTH